MYLRLHSYSKGLLIIALLLTVGATQIAHAQRSSQGTPPSMELKDTSKGTLYGAALWGGGHLYAGETNRGMVLLGIGAGSILLGSALVGDDLDLTPLYLGYAVSLGAWGYSIYDGGKAVERHNERVRSMSDVRIDVMPAVATQNRAPAPGVALRMSF